MKTRKNLLLLVLVLVITLGVLNKKIFAYSPSEYAEYDEMNIILGEVIEEKDEYIFLNILKVYDNVLSIEKIKEGNQIKIKLSEENSYSKEYDKYLLFGLEYDKYEDYFYFRKTQSYYEDGKESGLIPIGLDDEMIVDEASYNEYCYNISLFLECKTLSSFESKIANSYDTIKNFTNQKISKCYEEYEKINIVTLENVSYKDGILCGEIKKIIDDKDLKNKTTLEVKISSGFVPTNLNYNEYLLVDFSYDKKSKQYVLNQGGIFIPIKDGKVLTEFGYPIDYNNYKNISKNVKYNVFYDKNSELSYIRKVSIEDIEENLKELKIKVKENKKSYGCKGK